MKLTVINADAFDLGSGLAVLSALNEFLEKLSLLLGLAIPKEHIEFGYFVSVHAGGRDLDRTCPVEVVVAEGKGELLNCRFR